VSTINQTNRRRGSSFSRIVSVIDRIAMFVAYAVFLAVLPVAAVGLMTHTI
jgi:hypothetical protein